jgi:hypothetical protein
MSYIPPTPPLPAGEELEKILQAFGQLPAGPWRWFGCMNRKPNTDGSRLYLATPHSGQQYIMGLRSRMRNAASLQLRTADGIMEDAQEAAVYEQAYRDDITGLDNPAAIALASAWMVPLLVQKLGALEMVHAGCELDAKFSSARISQMQMLLNACETALNERDKEYTRRLAIAGHPMIDLVEANGAICGERDRMKQRLAATYPQNWVPADQRTSLDTCEWLHVLLPSGRVESAIFIDDNMENSAWCQWDENGYEVMLEQPTHFQHKPQPLSC